MKKQFGWGIVKHNHIDLRSIRWTRRDVIGAEITDWRPIVERSAVAWKAFENAATLSDAQLWRKLKRHYGWSVKRIAMRVIR